MEDKLRVLYILGHARSGSTILDILLGNHPQIVSTGELTHFYEHAFLDPQYCSCGQPILECAFWSGVVARLKAAGRGDIDAKRRLQLQQVFERHRYALLRAIQRLGSQRANEYQEQLLAHYHAIAAESGKSIVVDSSKQVLRARRLHELAQAGHLEARFLFLVRDGRGIIWSFQKQMDRQPELGRQKHFKRKSALRTTCSWMLANFLCEQVLKQVDAATTFRLRYEDLCANPQASLAALAAWAGVDPAPFERALGREDGLQISHLVAGSRHRMARQIRFQPDEEWRTRLTRTDKLVFQLVAGRHARCYGYQRDQPLAESAAARGPEPDCTRKAA
jgi:hypothetical protein